MFKIKTSLVRLNLTLLDISSHCYTDDNVKVVCSELYKYSQHGRVYGSNCANFKICRQIIQNIIQNYSNYSEFTRCKNGKYPHQECVGSVIYIDLKMRLQTL